MEIATLKAKLKNIEKSSPNAAREQARLVADALLAEAPGELTKDAGQLLQILDIIGAPAFRLAITRKRNSLQKEPLEKALPDLSLCLFLEDQLNLAKGYRHWGAELQQHYLQWILHHLQHHDSTRSARLG